MSIEKDIAIKLRRALEIAHENRELDRYYPFSKFPHDCCEHTCDILGNLLYTVGIKSKQINGSLKSDASRHHVWLKTSKDLIIDITEDQFLHDLAMEKEIKKIRVGLEGPIQKMFCESRKEQDNTIFITTEYYCGFGGIPNVRQKRLIDVFRIIEKYF